MPLPGETEAWPRLLQERLNAGSGRRVWVGNVGKSGQMTRNHVVQVEKLTRQYPRIDAVLLLAGVNDLMRRLKEDPPAADLMASSFAVLPSRGSGLVPVELRRRLRTVWQRYLERRGIRVVLLTQPALWRPRLSAEEQGLLWMGGVGAYQEEPRHECYTAEALAAGRLSER